MIGNRLEQDIIGLYNREITGLFSINQIATRLKKTYPYINKKVRFLIDNKILKKTVIGRSHLCSLNLKSDEAIFLLILNEIKNKKDLIKKNPKIRELVSTIQDLNKVVTINLALKVKGKVILVLEDTKQKNIIEKSALISSFRPYIWTKQEFLNMVFENKKILENHVILHAYENYYNYLKEVEDKLRLKYSPLLK